MHLSPTQCPGLHGQFYDLLESRLLQLSLQLFLGYDFQAIGTRWWLELQPLGHIQCHRLGLALWEEVAKNFSFKEHFWELPHDAFTSGTLATI